MTDDIRERLSALVDGEMKEQEAVSLLDRLNRDPGLKQTWERYHLVSDVMRNNLPPVPSVDLVDRVRRSLHDEPVVLRPAHRDVASLKPVASLALAASIAVVAVLGFRGYLGSPKAPDATVAHAELNQGANADSAGMRWDVDRPDVEQRLNAYLVNHNGHTGTGMSGVMPYARIVAYNGGR